MKIKKFIIITFMCSFMLFAGCGDNHEHQFSDVLRYDDINHWVECECGEKKDVTPHSVGDWVTIKDAACIDSGIKERTCGCGYKETDIINSTGHSFETTWTFDETNHWHKCENCDEIIDLDIHVWADGEVIKEATLSEDGEITKTCTCGATKVEKLDNYAKSAIEMKQPEKSFFGPDITDEEYEQLIGITQERVSIPMTIELNKDYYFKFDKKASSIEGHNYFSIMVTAPDDEYEGYLEDLDAVTDPYSVSLELYSENDLTQPIKVYNSFFYMFHGEDSIDNGTYYLRINIKSHQFSLEEDGKQVMREIFIIAQYSL